VDFRWVDEFDGSFGWAIEEVRRRTSHALVVDGDVWLVDPVVVPGLDERVRAAGVPRGVIQLLDRHKRDAREFAARLGVPHLRLPDHDHDTPFSFVPLVAMPGWHEVALWWPEQRVLACGDALGTLPYFVAPGERLGVYPWLRLAPPAGLRLVEPLHVLCGHGEGVHGDDTPALLREALDTSRRRMPGAARNGLRYLLRRGRV
jgi:glyoxylase-like metal-dependent hydrolase (beta-lactamase superfamily II)